MAPYYGPDEDPATIFLERSFLAGDFIAGVGYGLQLLMYGACAIYLWKTRKAQRSSLYLLVYITILLSVETIFEVTQAYTVQLVYVDNRNYPGGPWAFFLATQNLPVNVLFIASLFLITFLADLLVLWRCWVIWAALGRYSAYFAIAFPSLLLLGSFAVGVLWTLQSSQPGLSLYSKLPLAYGTSYYAISLSVNIILTILITARLLMYRRKIMATLPADHAREYVSLATIVIESASLYSVFALIFLITYAVNNPINSVFLTVASSSQQIANYIIIYRLSQGRAWDSDTVAKHNTTMDFRRSQQLDTTVITEINPDLINAEYSNTQRPNVDEERGVWKLGTSSNSRVEEIR